MADKNVFKQCPMCSFQWQFRKDLLLDKNLELNGYQADFKKLEYGLFFFTHKVDGCHSTMAILANEFLDMNSEQQFNQRLTKSEDCPRFCIDKEQLSRCEASCECAFIRNILQIIKDYK